MEAIRMFKGLVRSQDETDMDPQASTTSKNTDYFQEGSVSPRDGTVRTSFSGSTYGEIGSKCRSLIPVRRPEGHHMLAFKGSGSMQVARSISLAFDEDDY